MRTNHNEEQQPVLVQVPETGQQIDVLPFIEFIRREHAGDLQYALTCTRACADEIIETINLYCSFDYESPGIKPRLSLLYSFLYRVKKMLLLTTVQ